MNNQDELIARLFKDTLIIFLLSMFVSIIGYIIDGIITGNFLGEDSMAAFGLTMPYQRFVTIFPAVLVLGMQVMCSKFLGRGELREANGIFSLALAAALMIAILIAGATILFTAQIADILDAKEELGAIRPLTIDFLQAYAFGLPAIAAVTILPPIMQLDNDRQRAVIAAAVLALCDIAGDLINVSVLDGGLWGMGIATTISYWLAAGVLLLHFLKANSNFKFLPEAVSLKYFWQVILIGLPVILGRGTAVLRLAFFTRMSVALAGGVGVAAYAAIENFSGLLEIIPKALGSSTQMIGGILIGEQDKNSILRLMKLALKYSLIISLTITAAVFLGAPIIAGLYTLDTDPMAYQMTLEGLQLAIVFLPLCAVGIIFMYYYQACGRFKLVSNLTVAGNIGFIAPIVLILTPHFGIDALWLAFPLSYAAFLLTIFFITCRHCGRITFKLEDYLLLAEDFDVAKDKQLNITVTNKAEVLGLSEQTQKFCVACGIDEKRSMFAGICIEEMAGNIVNYGFDDGKKHFVDVRVIVKGEQVIIRIRDDCRPFDPKKWAEIHNPEDPAAHIGIRLVKKISTEFNYVNVLKLNNLIVKI
ncbi:MAG: ATP-binding protein [Selenomonadaceae bacterium]|nr:ATP-binding protein [Selenomonadaceae bacterium]